MLHDAGKVHVGLRLRLHVEVTTRRVHILGVTRYPTGASGLMRYGFVAGAQHIALGLFDTSEQFGNRLPELFCGFERKDFDAPIPYPTSCTPQAWAAVLYLPRTLLRFDPRVPFGQVWCAPAIPDKLLPLHIERLPLASATSPST